MFILLGNPVEHSLSPVIHNSACSDLGLNSVYLACPVEANRLKAALEGMKALSVVGANVTSPYKEAVIPFLDSISTESKQIRSVNTILNKNGHLHGTSTDGEGLFRSLKNAAPGYQSGQNIMMIGAGGAARAAAYTLATRGAAKMTVFNRSRQKGRELSAMLAEFTPVRQSSDLPFQKDVLKQTIANCKVIIYCLPFDSPEFIETLAEMDWPDHNPLLIDLRYSPTRTTVMAAFEDKGGKAVNGLDMLVGQAALSFELFTGKKAPLEVMQKAVGMV